MGAPGRTAAAATAQDPAAPAGGDVERTVRFFQDLPEFQLTEMIDNRGHAGSTPFCFDIGNGNLLAVDFPGLDVGPSADVPGGLHHVAISVEPVRREHLKARLDRAGVAYAHRAPRHRPRRCPGRADRRSAR